VAANLAAYDDHLRRCLGCSIKGLAARAAGIAEPQARRLLEGHRLACVPITAGEGLLEGFTETLAAIARHLGFEAFGTGAGDAAGVAEALERGATLLMMADDERFVVLNLEKRLVVDNAAATAAGFVKGLELMAGGLKGRSVLVLGCGAVGGHAAHWLACGAARVTVFDPLGERCTAIGRELEKRLGTDIAVAGGLKRALACHRLVFDASPAAGLIGAADLHPGSIVAAPGFPSGVTPGAAKRLGRRYLHDPLQIGTATMLLQALREAPPPRTAARAVGGMHAQQ
jgi:pyrrolysine biosynthesis protein PylD